MIKSSILFALLTVSAGAQTAVTFNENVTVQTGVNPYAMVINQDQTNTMILKNGITLNPGFESTVAHVLVQVGSSNLGSSTYFVSFNDSSIVLANEMVGATATIRRAGASPNIIGVAPVISNNAGDSAGTPTFTATTFNSSSAITATASGGSISLAIANNSAPNVPNGTWALTFSGGSPSASAAGTYTVASNVITATTLSNAGTGYASSPTVTTTSPITTIGSASVINGIPNGTYNLEVHRGAGSGGAATMNCTGASGSPVTGATCTPAIAAAGSGYTSAPSINVWNGYTLGTFTSGSWPGGATVGDYVSIYKDYGPSTQAMLVASGWGVSGTAVGEQSDLPNDAVLGDLPPGSQNNQAMLITGPTTIGNAFDTGIPQQNMYVMTDPITANVTIKRVSGSCNVSWSIARATAAGSGSGFSCSGSITPTNSWAFYPNYASSCTTGETVGGGGVIGQVNVNFTVPSGCQVELDNPYVAAASTGNASQFRDPVVTTLTNFGGPIRLLNNQMPMTLTDQLQPDTRSVHNYTFGDNCNNGQPLWSAGCVKIPPVTLPALLNLGAQIGHTVWSVVGVNLSATDGTTLAQYLGGGCGTTGGAIRCAQGVTTPYTTTYAGLSRQIKIELGNENWNGAGSGGKWRTVPQCTAGANCSADYASGANTNYPYGAYTQTFAAAFEGDASYNASVEQIELGLQMSGSNTTFGADNLFKATSTAGTPFVTAAVETAYAPYIDFSPTSAGFDNASFTRQIQSDLANAYWNNTQIAGQLYIPVKAYSNIPSTIYEVNGGMTGSSTSGSPLQNQVIGYQDSLGGGLAEMVNVSEACRSLAICGFRAHFVLLQQQQTFSNGTPVALTGTSSNGSNILTGVTITSDMVPGRSIQGAGLSTSTPDANGTAQIWFVGSSTLTLNRNLNCSTSCGSNTFNLTNVVAHLWGGAIGSGASSVNRLRPFMQLAQNENQYAIKYGSTLVQATYTSPTWNFPRVGTCPTACNGTPATNNIPLLNIYAYKQNAFHSYVFNNDDDNPQTVNLSGYSLSGTVTMVQTGSGLNWTDTNESASNVVPVITSVGMPSSLTLPAHTQTIISGNVNSSNSTNVLGGNIVLGGNTIH